MAAQNDLKGYMIGGRTTIVLDATGNVTTGGVAVDDVDQEEMRLLAAGLLRQGFMVNALDGSLNPNAFKVAQDTGSNMKVKVGSGTTKRDLYVLRGTAAGQGVYIVRLDAATSLVDVPAADGALPAKYCVWLIVDDAAYSGLASQAGFRLTCTRGTPNASPVAPSPNAGWSAYAKLATFQLAAGATAVTTSILNAGTDDREQAYTLLPASHLCTSGTRPSKPYTGMEITETDTLRTYQWNGTAWIYMYGGTQPLYSATMYRNAAWTVSGSPTVGIVPFDSVHFDYGSIATTGASAKFTVPVAGVYDLKARFSFTYNGAGADTNAAFYKNGASWANVYTQNLNAAGTSQNVSLAFQGVLAAGDTVDVRYQQGSGNPVAGSTGLGTFFSIAKVG